MMMMMIGQNISVKPSTLMLEQKEFDRPHLGTRCSFMLDVAV